MLERQAERLGVGETGPEARTDEAVCLPGAVVADGLAEPGEQVRRHARRHHRDDRLGEPVDVDVGRRAEQLGELVGRPVSVGAGAPRGSAPAATRHPWRAPCGSRCPAGAGPCSRPSRRRRAAGRPRVQVQALQLGGLELGRQADVDVQPVAGADDDEASGADQQRLEPVQARVELVEVGVEQVGRERDALLAARDRAQVRRDVDVVALGALERLVEEPLVVVGPAAVPFLPVLELVLVALVDVAADAEREQEVAAAVAPRALDPRFREAHAAASSPSSLSCLSRPIRAR